MVEYQSLPGERGPVKRPQAAERRRKPEPVAATSLLTPGPVLYGLSDYLVCRPMIMGLNCVGSKVRDLH